MCLLRLIVRDINGFLGNIDADQRSPIRELKESICKIIKKSKNEFSVIYRGKILEDSQTVEFYHIKDNSIIFISYNSNFDIKDHQNKSINQNKLSKSPNKSSTYSTLDDFILKMIKNDPQLYIDMLNSNPAFKQFQENNPEFRHFLNDPELIKEQLDMMENPGDDFSRANLLDRKIDTMESQPGGFQILSSQMNYIQETLTDNLANQNIIGQNKTIIPEKPLEKPAEEPLPPVNDEVEHESFFTNPFAFVNPSLSHDEFIEISNFHLVNKTESDQNANQFPKIPKEALNFINIGINQCESAGLLLENLPGFKTFVKECQAQALSNLSNASHDELLNALAPQLKRLKEMGFIDVNRNIEALIETKGDVSLAVYLLLYQIHE